MYRRRRLTALAVVAVVGLGVWAIVALAGRSGEETASQGDLLPPAAATTGAADTGASSSAVSESFPPGEAELVTQGPTDVRKVSITIDDGSCEECVGAIVRVLERTGVPATLFPNGIYAEQWAPHAEDVKRLVALNQVDLGNHTFSHANGTEQTQEELEADLKQNEDWIRATFGVDPRPVYRPTYGAYNDSTMEVAGRLGYTKVVNWSAGSKDWDTDKPKEIVAAVQEQLEPGAIILMHANGLWSAQALSKIVKLLEQEGYEPVTLRELLGV
jgi:peptidoglycan/xylan/chitin deacetylase (PgdA/CDA1 family)